MCERGTVKIVTLGNGPVAIDSCIVTLVEALNDAGILTVASCCGHSHRPGVIALADGRELFVLPDYNAARELDATFPFNIQGESSKPWEWEDSDDGND